MAREIKFVTRVDNSKIAQDTEQTRRLILAAYAPVQFEAPNIQSQQIRVATNASVNDGRLEKEQQLLDVAKLRADTEKQKNDIAISSLTQQVALANQVAEIRLNGERAAARIAEENRQKELQSTRGKGEDTTQLEIQHARQRQDEERKILALTNEVNRTRLQGELRIEQASSRSAISRLQSEGRVAAAAEKTARAQLEAAQAATGKATNDQERIAAENRVAEAVEKVTQAQRQREGVTQQLAAEQVSAEKRVADIAEKAAADRVQAENKVQAAKRETAKVATTGAGNSGVTNLLSGVNRAANLLTGGIQAFAAVQLVRQINNTASELDRLRVEATRSKVSLDILSGSSSNAAARIAAIQQAGAGAINTLSATQIAVQATALGLANTTGEFERLTTAARAVSLVSPIIKDVNSAISEISLAGANQSFRRLDQLGLGVQEVKDKIAELQAADKSLSDQQAFSAAVIDTLNSKYGALLKTTEAQASGQEKLSTAFADFKVALSDTAPIQAYDDALAFIAKRFKDFQAAITGDFKPLGNLQQIQAELDRLKAESEALAQTVKDMTPTDGEILLNVVGKDPAAAAEAQQQIDINEKKSKQLVELSGLTEKINKSQEKGVIVAGLYAESLAQLSGEITRQNQASIEQIAAIEEFNRVADALAQITSGNTQSSQVYLKAQDELGAAFINQDEDAKALLKSLVLLDVQFSKGDLTQSQYKASVNSISQALAGLSGAAKDYQKIAESQRRIKLVGDAQSGLVQAVENEAAQLIESTGKYEEVKANLAEQKQFIADEIAKIPTDINPDEIPLIVARIKFEVDNKSLQNLDQGGSGALINASSIKELQDVAAEKSKEARELVRDAKRELLKATQDKIVGLISEGLDPTEAQQKINEYNQSIEKFFSEIPKGIDPTSLEIKLSEYGRTLNKGLDEIANSLNLSSLNPQFALDDIVRSLEDLDVSAIGATPGLKSIRDELIGLYDDIQRTGEVTKEQADRLSELEGIAFAVGQTTGIYANQVADLGDSFFDTHAEAGQLFTAIAELEGKYVNGQVPIDQYKGAMSSLIDRLIELATQAGVTGKELADLIGLKTELDTTGTSLGVGFRQGRQAGSEKADVIRLKTAEETKREAERAADEWKRAGKEAENAAKRARSAFESSLQQVPGLFGSSGVTQEQLDLAAAGIPQNFADDFVRRLEDLLKNGVQRPGVTFERAREALSNINIQTEGLTNEQVFALIKKTFADSSLFANPANLDLINADAVKANLDMQKKQEEGKQNIVDYLSKTFDVNLAALTGGEVKAGTGTAGAVPPSAAQQSALAQQQQAQVALSLQVDDKAINAAATKSAQLFEKVFSSYDFSVMAAAPANAMVLSLATDNIAAAYRQTGIKAADLVQAGFTGRVSELEWLKSLRDAFYNDLVGDATSAVLSALS